MKIAFLHTDFRIYWEARLNALYELLKNYGIDMIAIEISGVGSPYTFASNSTRPKYWQILFPNTPITEIKGRELKKVIHKKLDEICPEVVFAGAIAFPSGANAVSWAKKHNKRVIIFDDARKEDVQRSGITNFIKKSIYNGVDAMLYPAPAWISTGHRWNFSEDKMFFGVDVVDNSFWQKPYKSIVKRRDYFINVGRQIPKKNLLFTLRSYKKYKEKMENPLDLYLVGNGEEHEKLIDFVNENQLNEYINFFDFASQEDLVNLYKNAACGCYSSIIDETWGLVINESMACGLPILASTEMGATSTLVQDGINGFTFSPYDEDDMVRAMVEFTNLSEIERIEMGKSSLRIIADWGLDKFSSACFDAIQYVTSHEARQPNFIEKFIINNWYGRYRPV